MQTDQTSSSEESDYHESFPQGSEGRSTEEEGAWDSFHEDPSYLLSSIPQCQRLNKEVKDTKRRSTTDGKLLDGRLLSSDLSLSAVEPLFEVFRAGEIEENVFESSRLEDPTVMAPPNADAVSPAQQLYEEFQDAYSNWSDDYKFIEDEANAELVEDDIKGVEDGFKKIDELYIQIQKADRNYVRNFPQLKTQRSNAFRDKRLYLKTIKNYLDTARTSTFDEEIDSFIEENKINFDIWKSRTDDTNGKLIKIIDEFPKLIISDSKKTLRSMLHTRVRIRRY